MPNRFKVGDRVEFVDWAEKPVRGYKWMGRTATVEGLASPYEGEPRIAIRWDKPNEYEDKTRTLVSRRFRLIVVNLDPVSIAKTTRGGFPVSDLYDTGDEDRPFGAVVHMPDGARRKFTFSRAGHFYKTSELPIDLVANA